MNFPKFLCSGKFPWTENLYRCRSFIIHAPESFFQGKARSCHNNATNISWKTVCILSQDCDILRRNYVPGKDQAEKWNVCGRNGLVSNGCPGPGGGDRNGRRAWNRFMIL